MFINVKFLLDCFRSSRKLLSLVIKICLLYFAVKTLRQNRMRLNSNTSFELDLTNTYNPVGSINKRSVFFDFEYFFGIGQGAPLVLLGAATMRECRGVRL